MTTFSSKEAQRRFHAVLKAADVGPVVIERHRRPRAAVVSMRRFEIYEALWRKEMDAMALESLQGALDAANEGKVRTSARMILRARSLARTGK